MEDITNFTLGDAATVLEFWKNFDLDARRLSLDQSCVDMREMKTSSISGRKRLNDATKSFRGKNRDDQAGSMTELLKLYQEEIDQLSRRSKFSESAFYSLYKSIYDAPNPSISIEGLVNMVAASSTNQLEIERLKSELDQYDKEFQLLKNQDITIRRLEDQLEEYRDQIEDKVMEEVYKRTSDVEGQAEIKINEIRDVQKTAERRLAAVVESMKQAQSSADRAQTQMFEISSQAEERVSALSSENAILAEGTERALRRVAELEGEVSNLKNSASLAASPSQRPLGSSGSSSKLAGGKGEEDSQTLQLVIMELRHEIRSKEDALRVEKQRLESKHRETVQLLSREREALGKIKLELAERPTHDDLSSLKRQIKMLQRVAFNATEDDDADNLNMESKTIPSGEVIPIELLLTSRMKSLESELAESKRSLRDAKMLEAAAKQSAASLRAEVASSTGLISRLEADLESQMKRSGGDNSMGGNRIDHTSNKASNQGGVGGSGGSMELSELLGVDIATLPSKSNNTSTTNINANTNTNDDSAKKAEGTIQAEGSGSDVPGQRQNQQMVDILQAQRDRYKDRLAAAESHSMGVQQRLDAAESSKLKLEQDNLALYTKMRYLQSVANGTAGTGKGQPMRIRSSAGYTGYDEEANLGSSSSNWSSRGAGRGGNRSIGGESEESRESGNPDRDREKDREVEGRYGELYEQRMNPFAEIEKQKRYQDLSVADRMVLNTTLAFVSSKQGRSFVVIYLVAMHLMMFFILYYNAHHIEHGCDPTMDALHRGGPIGGHLD